MSERLVSHNSGTGGAFTKLNGPWKLVCYCETDTEQEARMLEKKVKSYKGGTAFKKILHGDVAEWSKAAPC